MSNAASSAPVGDELAALRAAAATATRSLRHRIERLDDDSIDLILRGARSHYAWTDKPVDEALLRSLYDIVINGPTSMNNLPGKPAENDEGTGYRDHRA